MKNESLTLKFFWLVSFIVLLWIGINGAFNLFPGMWYVAVPFAVIISSAASIAGYKLWSTKNLAWGIGAAFFIVLAGWFDGNGVFKSMNNENSSQYKATVNQGYVVVLEDERDTLKAELKSDEGDRYSLIASAAAPRNAEIETLQAEKKRWNGLTTSKQRRLDQLLASTPAVDPAAQLRIRDIEGKINAKKSKIDDLNSQIRDAKNSSHVASNRQDVMFRWVTSKSKDEAEAGVKMAAIWGVIFAGFELFTVALAAGMAESNNRDSQPTQPTPRKRRRREEEDEILLDQLVDQHQPSIPPARNVVPMNQEMNPIAQGMRNAELEPEHEQEDDFEGMRVGDLLRPMTIEKGRKIVRKLNRVGALDRDYKSVEIARWDKPTITAHIADAVERLKPAAA